MAIIFLMPAFVFSLQGQGDIRSRPDSAFSGLTPTILWTNGLVPYVIDPDIPSPSRFTDAERG
jgi:hypothetical protein